MDDLSKVFIKYFFLVTLEINTFYLTFKYMISIFFNIFTATVSVPLKMLTIVWFICVNIVDQK